jgi:hypothetical protein
MITQLQPQIQQSNRYQHLVSRATAALQESHYSALRKIVCKAQGACLRLTGSVPTYFHKQLAQAALLREVDGAVRIQNDLQVRSPTRTD